MLESILSVLQNIADFLVNTFENIINLFDKIGDAIFNIGLLTGSNLLPSFLVSSIVVVTSIYLIKLILSMGSFSE